MTNLSWVNHLGARREMTRSRTIPEADDCGGVVGLRHTLHGGVPATPLMTLVSRRQTHHLLPRSMGLYV